MATPAGWYDDGSGRQRYWDGADWTDQYADPAPAAPAAPAAPSGGGSKTGLWIGIGVGALAVVGLIAAFAVFLITGRSESPAQVVEGYFDDAMAGDCQALVAAWHPDYLADTGFSDNDEFCEVFTAEELQSNFGDMEVEVAEGVVDGDTARVFITQTWSDGYSEEWILILERVDGDWLLIDDEFQG